MISEGSDGPAPQKRNRKDISNIRISDMLSLRRFICFNRDEFIEFSHDGITSHGRILQRMNNSALEITLYYLQASFDDLLKIRSLRPGSVSIIINENDVIKNIICYSRSEFGLGGIGAPSNKIPIINGISDVYVLHGNDCNI